MDETKIINILKRYSDKKTERVIKSPDFLFSASLWPHLAHSWPGLNYMCKTKYKTKYKTKCKTKYKNTWKWINTF